MSNLRNISLITFPHLFKNLFTSIASLAEGVKLYVKLHCKKLPCRPVEGAERRPGCRCDEAATRLISMTIFLLERQLYWKVLVYCYKCVNLPQRHCEAEATHSCLCLMRCLMYLKEVEFCSLPPQCSHESLSPIHRKYLKMRRSNRVKLLGVWDYKTEHQSQIQIQWKDLKHFLTLFFCNVSLATKASWPEWLTDVNELLAKAGMDFFFYALTCKLNWYARKERREKRGSWQII